MSNKIKQSIQKERLKLTAHTLQIYNEKFLKGDIENPVGILVDCMLNSPRDADKINAAKEVLRVCFTKQPNESEVTINEDIAVMDNEKRARLVELMKKAQASEEID